MAGILAEEAADVLVIYDEHGGYGHPDHVQVHRVGMRAADLAGTPIVYMATMNRDFMRSLADQLGTRRTGNPPKAVPTAWTPWVNRPPDHHRGRRDPMDRQKREAMAAHASQISETSFFLSMPADVFSMVWGHEWYIRVRPEAVPGPTGADLMLERRRRSIGCTAGSGTRVVRAPAAPTGRR